MSRGLSFIEDITAALPWVLRRHPSVAAGVFATSIGDSKNLRQSCQFAEVVKPQFYKINLDCFGAFRSKESAQKAQRHCVLPCLGEHDGHASSCA